VTLPFTSSSNAGFDGPKFEPEEDEALYTGLVADILPQKYFGSSKFWPIKDEPKTLPSPEKIKLPSACLWNADCAMAVTISG
jgi:hypothetical protein